MERLEQLGYAIETDPAAFKGGDLPVFELHIESQRARFPQVPQYLLLIEDRHIRPQNYFVRWSAYRLVFSWDDDIVESRHAVKYLFPAHISGGPVGDSENRRIFMSLVSANKAQAVRTRHDLYSERVRTLVWFQENAPEHLELYGPGWNMPIHPTGLMAKFAFKLLKRFGLFRHRGRVCWKGIAPVKRDVLLSSKFNLCYENTSGSRGYISEKLFDALSTGSIPIYWGAPNVADYVPADCFIDRRQFRSNGEMFEFLRNLSPERTRNYQEAMNRFCTTQAERFGIDNFASQISARLIANLTGGAR